MQESQIACPDWAVRSQIQPSCHGAVEQLACRAINRCAVPTGAYVADKKGECRNIALEVRDGQGVESCRRRHEDDDQQRDLN